MDYAIKKEKLLVDFDKNMKTKKLTALIAIELPDFILNRLNRGEIKEATDLFNELRKHKNLTIKKNFLNKTTIDFTRTSEEKKPCKTYENLGKGGKYHPSEKCWFKAKEEDIKKNIAKKKVNNNSILDVKLYDEEKNE